MGGRLPDVGGHIHDSLFNGQHHDWGNDRNSDAGQHSQSARSNQLVGVLEGKPLRQKYILILCAKVIPEAYPTSSLCIFFLSSGERGSQGLVSLRTPLFSRQNGCFPFLRKGRRGGEVVVALHTPSPETCVSVHPQFSTTESLSIFHFFWWGRETLGWFLYTPSLQ